MVYSPSAKELSHFPFLKKAQDHVKGRFSSLDSLLKDKKGEALVERALARIQDAITPRKTFTPEVSGSTEDEIAGYALARVVVSCVNDRQLIDRLTRYESERAYFFLVNEEDWNQNYRQEEGEYSRLCVALAEELGIRITLDRMPFADYVELVAPLHDDRFHLVNRRVENSFVAIKKEERYELVRERIRLMLRRDLPHKVPSSLCEQLAPRVTLLKKAYQEQMLQQFGSIEESAFPPCMQALITALTAGTNLTHAGRFSLTTFLHTIGMNVNGIAELYARSPDFDAERTMYQVEHITGRGGSGTEYNTPACAAMRTTGICVHRDVLCEKVSHPLSYYKAKKRDQAGKFSKQGAVTGKEKGKQGEEKPPVPPT
ncbi:DNA primase regulatory subunit PriL [Methanoregula sp.]|uniref:DNA primase regulatory subunit PriL n=1 Tax=Methanoregula sp. TaxID=2052170 RepID=UPI003C77E10B